MYEDEYVVSLREERLLDQQHDCREFVESLVDQLYSDEPLNVAKFESDLEELCHVLRIVLPCKSLQVKRDKVTVSPSVQSWAEFNNNYLHQLAI